MTPQIAALVFAALVAAAGAQTTLGPEILVNPGAESGVWGWQAMGSSISAPSGDAHAGERAFLVEDRPQSWGGIAQPLPTDLPPGRYEVSAWVKVLAGGSQRAMLTVKTADAAGVRYRQAADMPVAPNEWVRLRGWHEHAPQGTVTELLFYAEGPAAGIDFLVDDFSMRAVGVGGDWRAEADARIEQIRKGDARVVVLDQHDRPVAGAGVAVEQTRRGFPFGSAIAAAGLGNPQYEAFFREHFNWAVTENEMKWQWTHPWPGADLYQAGDQLLAFCEGHGIPLRAHNLFWAVEQYVPQWVRGLSDTELRAAVDERIDEIVGRYAGRVPHWDVNNEMLHGSFFADRLGGEINAHMFQRARQVDPRAMLFTNDYNVIAGSRTFEYAAQIRGLLDAGAPIDGIGVQGHFGPDVDPVDVLNRLDVLAEFGLPIWVTEFDVNTPDENDLAEEFEDFYRAAYSHPSVGGILMWGFWEDLHWRPNSAIVNSDWTLNAAGERYLALMEEWTTEAAGESGEDGVFAFRGFHGAYRALVTPPGGGEGVEAAFEVDADPDVDEVVVRIGAQDPCPADMDGDASVTVGDLLAFLAAFGAQEPAADIDGTPGVGVGDLLAYLTAFREGCPDS